MPDDAAPVRACKLDLSAWHIFTGVTVPFLVFISTSPLLLFRDASDGDIG
jgi:hypothetical protein